FLVAFCARLKTYGAFFGDKNHKAFSRFCLCGHEKSGLRKVSTIIMSACWRSLPYRQLRKSPEATDSL
ncbi:hypothetical protein AAIG96_32960, partial [Pseudomonas aeruginosa]